MSEPRRDHYIAPSLGDDTELGLSSMPPSSRWGSFAALPTTTRPRHLASLSAEVTHRRLRSAVTHARDQGCAWAQIADLLGVTRASAWQRFAHHDDGPTEHRSN